MKRLAAALLAAALTALTTPARAAEAPSYRLAVDAPGTAAAVAGALTLNLLKGELAPATCRWCTPDALDADVARAVVWRDPDAASRASDLVAAGLGSAALLWTVADGAGRGDAGAGWANAMLVTQATGIALLVQATVAYGVGRARPYAWRSGVALEDRRANVSFFSGHTAFAFAVASSTSTLLLDQGATGAVPFAVASFTTAALVGYLRMAADQHYLTDVLAGAAVGSAVGWAVPHLAHAPRQQGVARAGAPLGAVTLSW